MHIRPLQRRRHTRNSPVQLLERARPELYKPSERGTLWVPNWSSMAVTCGVAGWWPSGMIAGVAVRLLYLVFRQVMAWFGLLAA
jgi:hypothetical protein